MRAHKSGSRYRTSSMSEVGKAENGSTSQAITPLGAGRLHAFPSMISRELYLLRRQSRDTRSRLAGERAGAALTHELTLRSPPAPTGRGVSRIIRVSRSTGVRCNPCRSELAREEANTAAPFSMAHALLSQSRWRTIQSIPSLSHMSRDNLPVHDAKRRCNIRPITQP
jgi:hypothetical protein